MEIRGRTLRLGNNINTDFIISGRYKFAITDMKELARHIMEDIDPDFPGKIIPGESVLVAGNNFGMGSSREQAPLVIKESGIQAVLANSFARIFFRNSFNVGLLLIEVDTRGIKEGDELEIGVDTGIVRDLTAKLELKARPVPAFMQEILKAGGIVSYYKKYGRLPEVE